MSVFTWVVWLQTMLINRTKLRYNRRRGNLLSPYLKPQYLFAFLCFFATTLFIVIRNVPNSTFDSSNHTAASMANSNLDPTAIAIDSDHKQDEKLLQTDSKRDLDIDNVIISNDNSYNIDLEGRIQIFYYPWYGNPTFDNSYIHWNHDILPHWQESVNKKFEIGKMYNPDENEIGANFYPKLGAYSSQDSTIIKSHFHSLLAINVSVLIVSWHSPEAIKNNPNKAFAAKDKVTANNLDLLFEIANLKEFDYGNSIKIAIHLEPYNGRNAESTFKDIEYIYNKYGDNNALYRSKRHNNLPFFYCYDSYKMSDAEWKKLLIDKNSKYYLRGDTSKLNGVFLGLYLNHDTSETHILNCGFDGFYTYFAAKGFTDGSSPSTSWNFMSKWSKSNNLLFVPSVGPGYDDTRIRPWNARNRKNRENGEYYRSFWKVINHLNRNFNSRLNEDQSKNDILNNVNDEMKDKSNINNDDNIDALPFEYVSITSFNEWHEGTQIEESIAKTSDNGFKYSDFENEGGSDAYMKMTHELANNFIQFVNKFYQDRDSWLKSS